MTPNSDSKLFCFSPPVMFATATIELALALHTFWRYRHSVIGSLATMTLVCLGLFQVAEFQICEGVAWQNVFWTKLGLVAITLLPALGLHMVEEIGQTKRFWWLGYLCAMLYVLLFVGTNAIVYGGICGGNYVIIEMQPIAYGAYYFGFLFLALFQAWYALKKRLVHSLHHRDALKWLIVGYLSFMVPMGGAYVLAPSVHQAVPSVMCGFAVMLALILAWRVLPLYHRDEHHHVHVKRKNQASKTVGTK